MPHLIPSAAMRCWLRQLQQQRANAVPSAEKVVQQVCFRQFLGIISMGSPQVQVLQYDTSTFLTASHLLQEGDHFGSDSLV